MKTKTAEKEIAELLKVLGSEVRVRILYSIGHGEACVCHLETVLKKRQAYISQHLMVLRDAGILDTRRDGKYIFYRVMDPGIFSLIETAAGVAGISADHLPEFSEPGTLANCACPSCGPEYSHEEI
ncbi:MAG: ArsR/SmtB family transcription factor [Anaerolineales bacterium]